MPTMKNSGELIQSISTDLADNNAGLISAEDVRHNMEDVAFSINRIVCSGDTNDTFAFYNNVRARQLNTGDATEGIFVAESGVQFPNWPVTVAGLDNNTQIQPFPGINNLDHGDLNEASLADDDHPAYYALNGARACTDDFVLGNNWINASGYQDMGFKFVPVGPGQDQEIYTSGTLRFADGGSMENAKGVAKAWVQFDGSGALTNAPVVRGYHGISGVIRTNPGKYLIYFNSGVFKDDNYCAIGNANGTTASGSKEDMTVNSVGFVTRTSVDNNPDLRQTTVVVRTESGDYSDSELIDCVFYGYSVGEASGAPTPSVFNAANYTDP